MFNEAQIQEVSQAVEIAEDVTANYFKISTAKWRHVRYDVRTLAELTADEVTDSAFAQIIRYTREPGHALSPGHLYDYFKICLQDHNIMAAVERDEPLELFPLAVYIVTHELVQVVRFCTFLQSFEAGQRKRHQEEKRVHGITQNVLSTLNLSNLDYVLRAYHNYGLMEMFQDHADAS